MFWRTKAGERIDIQKMTDTHLANTIDHMKRAVARAIEDQDLTYMSACGFDGDSMASYYAWGETDDSDRLVARRQTLLRGLEEEQARRKKLGITIPSPPKGWTEAFLKTQLRK